MQQPRIGVVLSGCGYLDGAEIRESVLTLLHLDRLGAEAVCFAPRRAQMHVVDHATATVVEGESRDVFAEAARIARGAVQDLASADPSALDGLVLPGGFGAAKNLSNFAVAGSEAEVEPDLVALIEAIRAARKPIGAICIAPAVLALALRGGDVTVRLTIGDDADTAGAIRSTGASHEDCATADAVFDEMNLIASTPAYMDDAARLADVSSGIEKCVEQVVRWARGGEA